MFIENWKDFILYQINMIQNISIYSNQKEIVIDIYINRDIDRIDDYRNYYFQCILCFTDLQ